MIVAVLDACVLYPPSLRDLLMRIADEEAYEPRWTDAIHAEWMRSVLDDHSNLTRTQLERTRHLMDQINPRCLVTGYDAYLSSLVLPDKNDRHVLAAAIASSATRIVTFNLKDFPISALQSYGIVPIHPDAFLCAVCDEEPELFLQAVRKHRASLKNPPKSVEDYLQTLRANGLNETALRMEAFSAGI